MADFHAGSNDRFSRVGNLQASDGFNEEQNRSEHGQMVNSRFVILLAGSAFSFATAAASKCTAPTEYSPSYCPFAMPKISQITISKNAAKSTIEDDPSVDCSKFVLTAKTVRKYFARARLVARRTRYHDLDWSACYASGTMKYSNGRQLEWTIMHVGVAYLYENGRPEKRFVCETCEFEPFAFK